MGEPAAAPANHGGQALRGEPRGHGAAGLVRRVSVFGQARPLDAPAEPNEQRVPKPPESPEWIEIRDKRSKRWRRARICGCSRTLGPRCLRTDGLQAFAETLSVASQWLEMYWSQTYPLVDEDAMLRRNALNCFADPMAVVDGLRRVPLVRSRQHGTFSLRDIDIATNQLAPSQGDTPADESSDSMRPFRRCRLPSSRSCSRASSARSRR